MVNAWTRPTRAIINQGALKENIQQERANLPSEVALFAVVKANAYGHGALTLAKTISQVGVDGFCVSNLDEAIELREGGIEEAILVLGPVDLNYFAKLINYDLTLTAVSLTWLSEASQIAKEEKKKLKLHIKIDSGMGRLGFRSVRDFETALAIITSNRYLELEGLFTHFATADEVDQTYYQKQRARFQAFVERAPKNLKYIHTANSATAFWHELNGTNMIRFGVGMYGLNPSGEALPPPFQLKEVFSLESELVQVKKVKAGSGISYGKTYEAAQDEWIGTVPIGYADGIVRKYSGYSLIVAGERVPIVGRVAMDYLMVRLPREFPVGTTVTLFGKNGQETNTIQSAAEHLETINYEVTCLISERVPRIYL